MMILKILGSGCANCKRLEALTQKVVENHKLDAEIIKVTQYDQIMEYPILSTPALVMNEEVLVSGRIPAISEIENWLLQG
ncbi:MAG: hypothetical protein BGO78_06540 [Chloroflexi bacterium 44-23]|nr:MAG: hypothetical protein BGO78_06540 [Chloroflexi bacterium 44-23]